MKSGEKAWKGHTSGESTFCWRGRSHTVPPEHKDAWTGIVICAGGTEGTQIKYSRIVYYVTSTLSGTEIDSTTDNNVSLTPMQVSVSAKLFFGKTLHFQTILDLRIAGKRLWMCIMIHVTQMKNPLKQQSENRDSDLIWDLWPAHLHLGKQQMTKWLLLFSTLLTIPAFGHEETKEILP